MNEKIIQRYKEKLQRMGIDSKDLEFIDCGAMGCAFRYADGVVKITTDEYEVRLASKIKKKGNLKHLPKIYSIFELNKTHLKGSDENITWIILMEYVEETGSTIFDESNYYWFSDWHTIASKKGFKFDENTDVGKLIPHIKNYIDTLGTSFVVDTQDYNEKKII